MTMQRHGLPSRTGSCTSDCACRKRSLFSLSSDHHTSYPLPSRPLNAAPSPLVIAMITHRKKKQWSNIFDATIRSMEAFAALHSDRRLSSPPARTFPLIQRLHFILTLSRHVFCPPCAEKTGLLAAHHEQRRCPQCKSDLNNANDVLRNLLSPPEDWKASVLAGLDPATIMECAQRALSFWTYQNAQEQ